MSNLEATCVQEELFRGSGQPTISFIIPVWNDEKNIARCLRSIRNLDFSQHQYEVIILDNGSTDNTHRIMEDMGFAFKIIEKVHVSALRNRGAAIAQGEYLAFVDSDVELSPSWLGPSLAALSDPRVVGAGCFPHVPLDSTWVQRAWEIHQKGREMKNVLAPVRWLPSMNLVVRREAFLAVGGFNERLVTAEDVDLCYRLGAKGAILGNPAMEAIHWGEAPDLSTFWKKEVWRGKGSFSGLRSHGFRWDELPSLGYPLYILGLCVALAVGSIWDLVQGQMLVGPICLALLVFPAGLLAMRTTWCSNNGGKVLPLFVLYLVYGLARANSAVQTLLEGLPSSRSPQTAVKGDMDAD
ncbi:glycosyltransferase [Candidatus Nitronereus thalassa]|uniref:Glycosyltransferase n=1 Tax=Candidatus Nitronereus thalassa TaxID=3020898 RepID=A0ABU3K6J8_9BACT|nr:glycosyltransferase [Candidatus Nitronereus thalassa]MDT7041977.1 glycosyltransferase [Candidatus Nitronereus thalassa]